MDINTNTLNKILAKLIQQHTKKLTQHDQVGFVSGMKAQFLLENSLQFTY